VDELENRVRRAALDAISRDAALAPRDAARVEREARRQEKAEAAQRIDSLKAIVRKFRTALRDRGDVGTVSFRRFRKRRWVQLVSRRPRGWVVASLPAEVVLKGEFAGALRRCELQLILGTDGKLHVAADGTIYERFRIGQSYHPEMPVTFPMQTWRDLEDRVPEFVGNLVGRLQLTWQID